MAVNLSKIDTYAVRGTHPDYDGPFDVQLIATSQRAAIARTRMTAFHLYQDGRWLKADYVVTAVERGVWPNRV